MTNSGKYLAHLIIKGVKSNFNPIIAIYEDLYDIIPHLLKLFSNDESNKNIIFILQVKIN